MLKRARKDLATDISNSKQARIDIQYYVEKQLNQDRIKRDVKKAHAFVLMLEKTMEGLEIDRIEEARKHLETLHARYHGGLDFGCLLWLHKAYPSFPYTTFREIENVSSNARHHGNESSNNNEELNTGRSR